MSAFTLDGGPAGASDSPTTQLYAVCRLRWLMGQRVWVRREKWGRDARWIAQRSSELHSSSALGAAFPRPSAILERGKSVCFLSPSLTTWHSFGKARLLCCSSTEDTLCSSHLGDIMFAEKRFSREPTFFYFDWFWFLFPSHFASRSCAL